ncbi:hypothetical protein ACIRBY_37130 [Streptomyces sp. NPDC096136]|uniref:hypothetical protein n=1 Tax=Streptomyces sp. NPDC096136 TaxID=3366076 RepID=UPI0038144AA3
MSTEDPYEHRPTAVIYDIFAEASNRLIGAYTHRSDQAVTDEDSDHWWQLAMEVRNTKLAVPARDRAQLIEYIGRWTAEAERLEAGE